MFSNDPISRFKEIHDKNIIKVKRNSGDLKEETTKCCEFEEKVIKSTKIREYMHSECLSQSSNETSRNEHVPLVVESCSHEVGQKQLRNVNNPNSSTVADKQLTVSNDYEFKNNFTIAESKLNNNLDVWINETSYDNDRISVNASKIRSSFDRLLTEMGKSNEESSQPSKQEKFDGKCSSLINDLSQSYKFDNSTNFKRGILFSSTPKQLIHPAKKLKRNVDNLSIIVEAAETSFSLIGNEGEAEKTLANHEEIDGENTFKNHLSKIEKTILEKDEISMIFEETIDKEVDKNLKPNQQNDVTIKVQNDLLIVYKNIKERTIDEVLLNDGNITKEMEVMYNLDREPDRDRILEKANNLHEFISNNEQENKDNFNPEWEVMKKLSTDDERYKAVRKLWMNLDIPDPKENLSSFNWRKRNCLGAPSKNSLPNIIKENNLSAKKFHCTEVFDVAIQKLLHFYESRKQGMKVDETYEHAIMSSLPKLPKQQIIGGKKKLLVTYEQLYSCFQERLHRNQVAKQEIEAIHNFYNGLKNRDKNSSDLMFLSYKEREDILAVEDIITSYSYWY